MKLTTQEKDYILSKKPTLWLKEYNIKNEQGLPIEFQNHLFLYDIYNDFSPLQVIMKAAQIGFSTLAIIKTLFLCKLRKMDAIYTLPTVGDMHQFVGGKVNRIIDQNPILKSWVDNKDNVDQKSVGSNFIYYRGTATDRAALTITSDANVHDELDRSYLPNVEQYHSRLQHSPYKYEWFFSNPSSPRRGVDKFWERSDQMHWFHKCPSCNYRQYLSWPDSIDLERETFICKKCHKELPDDVRRVGEWINKYEMGSKRKIEKDFVTIDFRGYWINLMMAPWTSAKEIIKLSKTKSEEYFYNFVLGLPYTGSGNIVSEEIIKQNISEDKIITDNTRVIIGVDTGITSYYVVGNAKGIFEYGSCEGYEEIERLLKKYPRSVAIFDQGGDLTAPRRLREKYRGRIFLCHYSVDRKTYQLVRWGKDDEAGNVIVDRNRMIQMIIDEFNAGDKIILQGKEDYWYDYILHWKNIYRVKEENMLGVMESRWERSGDDHLVHATVYWRAGAERFTSTKGMIFNSQYEEKVPLVPDFKIGEGLPMKWDRTKKK